MLTEKQRMCATNYVFIIVKFVSVKNDARPIMFTLTIILKKKELL